MKPEPWELSDDQLWGEINYAALMEAFRRSEISEKREARQARELVVHPFRMQDLVNMLAALVAPMTAQVEQMQRTVEIMRMLSAPAAQPLSAARARRPDSLPPVPNLRAALATNARPRPGPCQRQRAHHAQRR